MMDRVFRDRIIEYYRNITSRHKRFRVPVFVVLSMILWVHDMLLKLAGSWKKYALVSFLLVMFLVGSSFTYPVFGGRADVSEEETVQEDRTAGESTIELAEKEEVLPEEVLLLDDEDVMEGYVDAELSGLEELDRYTTDEILENNEFQDAAGIEMEVMEGAVSFSADDWRLILINKQHPIPEDYSFSLGTIKGNMQCDERIIQDLLGMLKAAREDGIDLVICSPYRDLSRQERLFNRKIDVYMEKGMSYLEAYQLSSQSVTVPGASEHQIGLALDIVTGDYAMLDAGFADTDAGKWLSEHSAEYGFILRYPAGKEYITSIEFEPWHFRYVGKEAAGVIAAEGICLEEFAEQYL